MTWIYIVLCCLFNINYGHMVVQPTLNNDINNTQEVQIEKKSRDNYMSAGNGLLVASLSELLNYNTLYYVVTNNGTTDVENAIIGTTYNVIIFNGNYYLINWSNLPSSANTFLSYADNDHVVTSCTLEIINKYVTQPVSWINYRITLTSTLFTFACTFYYLIPRSATPFYNESISGLSGNDVNSAYVFTDAYPSDYVKSLLVNPNSGTYEQGYDIGYNNGELAGYEQGYDIGYNDGQLYGYQEGLNDGTNADATATTIFAGVLDVSMIPVNVFLLMFNYEVFGINIAGFITGLITIAMIIIIIRFVLGR